VCLDADDHYREDFYSAIRGCLIRSVCFVPRITPLGTGLGTAHDLPDDVGSMDCFVSPFLMFLGRHLAGHRSSSNAT
jgi:hypothetical protein